jgi:hypothetical protein
MTVAGAAVATAKAAPHFPIGMVLTLVKTLLFQAPDSVANFRELPIDCQISDPGLIFASFLQSSFSVN